MKKIFLLFSVIFCIASGAFAQVRPVETKTEETKSVRPAPASFAAKYEGGMFGFSKKENGTLKFDDDNARLVFFGKDGKEKFGIPYKSLLVIFPQSKSVQSTTGRVVSAVPYGGILGGFIREKRRYLVMNFDDPDVDAKGLVNFRLADKDLLDSVLVALSQKANLKSRGDAFYRPKAADKTDDK
jgi:hypothetical protein